MSTRDPRLAEAFTDLARTGAAATEPGDLLTTVRSRVRRRRAARRVGAGVTGLAVVAAVAVGAVQLAPQLSTPHLGGAQTTVMGDYPSYTLDQLLARADVVLAGTVTATRDAQDGLLDPDAGLPPGITATVPTRFVTLRVDTALRGEVQAGQEVVVGQTIGSDWEPALEQGKTYLVFGEQRADGALNILGGSAGVFVADGDGFTALLPAAAPVGRLTLAEVTALLADGDGGGETESPVTVPPGRPTHSAGLMPNWPDDVDPFSVGTLAVAWGLDPGVFYVTTWGSGSCPAVPTDATWEGGTLHVTLGFVSSHTGEPLSPDTACTDDLSPHTTIVRTPDGVDESAEVPVLFTWPTGLQCVRQFTGTLLPDQTTARDGAPFGFLAPKPDGELCGTPAHEE